MKTPKFFPIRRCVGTYYDFLVSRYGPEVKRSAPEQSEAHFIEGYSVLLQIITDQGVDLPEPIVRKFPIMKMKGNVPSTNAIIKWNKSYVKWLDQLSEEFFGRIYDAPVMWTEIA